MNIIKDYIEYHEQEQEDMLLIIDLIRDINIELHKERKDDKIIETSTEN